MRLEYKYLLPSHLLPRVRAMIAPFVEADVHHHEPDGYTVRSIYFDTAALSCYHDKRAGLRVRKKIRVRGYDERRESDRVFLEVKRKSGMSVAKSRAPVRYQCIEPLLCSGDVERYVLADGTFPHAIDDARCFFFHLYGSSMRPIIQVVYEREAYHGKFEPLRMTFDKNVRSSLCPTIDALFSEDNTIYSTSRHFILEIKLSGGFPSWLKSIIGTLNLKHQALSKYNICIDSHKALSGLRKRLMLASYYAALPPNNLPFDSSVPHR